MEKWMHIYENHFRVAEAYSTKYTNNLLKLVKLAKICCKIVNSIYKTNVLQYTWCDKFG